MGDSLLELHFGGLLYMGDFSFVGLDGQIRIGILSEEIDQSAVGLMDLNQIKRKDLVLFDADVDRLVASGSDQRQELGFIVV